MSLPLQAYREQFEAHHVTATGIFHCQHRRAAVVDYAGRFPRPTTGNQDNHRDCSIALCRTLYGDCRFAVLERSWGFSTLAGVGTLFLNPWLLLAGWVHYLAFDLLIGSWEVEDARERGIPHLIVIPCLVLTFMFGPAGRLLYRIVRSVRGKGSN